MRLEVQHLAAMAGVLNTIFFLFNVYFARRNGRVLRTSQRLRGGFSPRRDIFDSVGDSIGGVIASGLRKNVGGLVPSPSGGKKITK